MDWYEWCVQLTSLLVARLHVDLRRTASATCRA
ncbi:putative leader peptide [Streptomyces sp. 2MCAF27]